MRPSNLPNLNLSIPKFNSKEEDTKIAEFRQLKESGTLKMGFRQSKLTTCNQTVRAHRTAGHHWHLHQLYIFRSRTPSRLTDCSDSGTALCSRIRW